MPQSFIDLHTHSTASDGTFFPADVARTAKDAGLSAFALTDHDTIAGIAEAAAEAKKIDIDFIAGIEISAEYPRPGTLHMLGYGVDPAHPALTQFCADLIEARDNRNERLVEKLRRLNVDISMEEVVAASGGGVIGRPHFARVLLNKGYAKTNAEVFNKYLGQGGLAYLDKERFTARQAIELIHQSGGLVSLAHPVQLRKENDAQMTNEIKNLADQGLDAVEVIHSDHRESTVATLTEIAKKFGLLCTGGSDFHGTNKSHIKLGYAGTRRIPRVFFDALLARLQRPS